MFDDDDMDEETLNPTQKRADEEGTIWRDVGPAEVVTGPEEEPEEPSAA